MPPIIDHANKIFDGEGKNQKTFIYCPDAVGDKHYIKYPEYLKQVQALAGFKMLSTSVMPSVTPVCFCTIFSGASPEVHGIKQWAQPVVQVERIFDIFAAAGKSVAIIAKNQCSMDRIFRNRPIDYYTTRSDEVSWKITEHLIADSDYDLIVSYAYLHDWLSHRTGADSPQTIAALKGCCDNFSSFGS